MSDKQTLKEIQNILTKHLENKDYKFFVFGSRATGQPSKWSDFDIGIQGETKVPLAKLSAIKGDLEESSIPYKVDVVDFSRLPEKFKKVALTTTIKL